MTEATKKSLSKKTLPALNLSQLRELSSTEAASVAAGKFVSIVLVF